MKAPTRCPLHFFRENQLGRSSEYLSLAHLSRIPTLYFTCGIAGFFVLSCSLHISEGVVNDC